mgnify:CR=1 FL=1
MGGSPAYIPDKKLGKGGFGQVWLGRRVIPAKKSSAKDTDQAASLVSVLSHCGVTGARHVI